MRSPDDYPFDARGPVGRYWLVHGVGFTVCRDDGRELGVVEDVVVDPVRQYAERVIVHRRGLVPRRRATIHASAIEAVAPASQRFLVGSPPRRVSTRRVAAVAARLSRSAARAGTGAAAAAGRRARRDAPRLESWLSTRARTAGRTTLAALGFVGTLALSVIRHAGVGVVLVARMLSELAMLAAVLAAAAWRRATAAATPRAPDADAPPSPSDADAPLSREASSEARTPARRL